MTDPSKQNTWKLHQAAFFHLDWTATPPSQGLSRFKRNNLHRERERDRETEKQSISSPKIILPLLFLITGLYGAITGIREQEKRRKECVRNPPLHLVRLLMSFSYKLNC
ncbi:hypothetical protein Sjap_000882 [Stephania japonica]|uniref:Uncharacterized protein n=1 Tax=Stephania japonica TaxID=461633 RepID=A0AAP0KIY3_9MAGN